jgi:hypothetical protein
MKKRTSMIAAALALGAVTCTVSVPGVARAQDGVSPQRAASDGLPPKPEDRIFITPEKLFSAPATLGDAWETALRAVLDGMKQYVEQERLAAEKTVVAPRVVALGSNTLSVRLRKNAAARFVVAPAPLPVVRPAPLPYEPFTYADDGARKGESGVLPGISVALPWLVP